ncbi:MAG: bifunctional acetate--CoA ligase family protein/GNAT family N-acetyltransferase [Phaeodactylibacter sp.]|nr:bifunctional acetate--CoA ligase family protein/GNAT family N-acetyltransferase [Phaeodactylibacter sp.]MCB9272547.1 bifunctional acetate--CoA ligase family protein/GNAT family N-acetyltransferase [Lewinellaceae bacterium]
MHRKLKQIFQPKSIAVIGASNREETVGYAVMKNLLEGGFEGELYPVNLNHNKIQGQKCYHHVGDIQADIDLAVIITPAKAVPQIVEECGQAGVGGLVIISAGFKEAGEEGMKMYEDIGRKARRYNMRVVGPNCLGFINPHLGVNASFATRTALPGNIAFISQSGALCTSILDWALDQSVGFSHFVSIGSMLDVDFADLIDYLGTDSRTSCILIYMESLIDARKFMSAARAFARSKPIIILKAGRSAEGGQATLSHTGSMAGNDAVYDAAFDRAGIIRVDTIAQLFNCAQSLAMQPRPLGNRLAIVTNAGGPGVLATDYLMRNGGALAKLAPETMEGLNSVLPAHWSHNNPVDVLGDASAEHYRQALELCLKDPNVDGVLTILTTQAVTNPTDVAKVLVEVSANYKKPILASWMGEEDVREGREILEAGKIPQYRYPESAVDVFIKMYRYSSNLELLYQTPPAIPQQTHLNTDVARAIIYTIMDEGRTILMENESKELMKSYGIATAAFKMVPTADLAVKFSEEIGYPVVLKIASPDISHKTDVGGVVVGLNNAIEVREAFEGIIKRAKEKRPEAEIRGVLVEKMAKKKYELLIGAKKDPIFGPVIAFGKGGVAVEVYRDMQLGLPPLNRMLARRIIEGTRIYPLLKGYRGMPGVNLEELEMTLVKFAYLAMDFPEIREIDINPFVMDETGALAIDARIMLETEKAPAKGKPYRHLVISPYPEKYSKAILLKSGQVARLRPIRPEDEPMEARMLEKISRESLYFRFFGFVPTVTHDFLTRFTHIDYDREMAIIATVEEAGTEKMVGVVRIISDAWGETAEYAILVSDDWQGLGLGSQATDYIIDIAREMGIKKLYASVLATNKAMLGLFEKKGFSVQREDFETFRVELPLVAEEVAVEEE